MPRTKKPPGQAVDRRNGRRAEIVAAPLAPFDLPTPRRPAWAVETRRCWDALWSDPVSEVLTESDRVVLLRWADSIDRAARALRRGDRKPVVLGSVGQVTEHPSYATAKTALAVAEKCEAQLGIGALNRARLGLAVLQEKRSLLDLNAAFLDEGAEEEDPRD